MKAKKKPVIIDYLDLNDSDSLDQKLYHISEWVKSFGDSMCDNFRFDSVTGEIFVLTLEGTSYAVSPENDVIIRGIKGEFYPCKKDVFYRTYDLL